MQHYIALIDEEDGKFGVSFPDLPGCTTVGRSFQEALAKAAQVLPFHLEGLAEDGPVPQPRPFEELVKDRQFYDDAAAVKGKAVVVPVPYDPPAKPVRLNVSLDESLVARIDAAAKAAGETRSGFLAEAARRRLAAG
jgi:predicted RNase H-like HicB family nuclease